MERGLRGAALIEWLRADYSAAQRPIAGPFGPRPLVYADFTASGRVLPAIDAIVANAVAPFYANTHSETAFTGMQTTRLREDAREIVREAVGADRRHAVIFAGGGATGAIGKLVGGLRPGPESVVFLGPYEHHSNDLPWRESGAEIERLPLDEAGTPCLATLAAALARHGGRRIIGAFSAASNVTGIKCDLRAVARLIHAHGGWMCADFAAGAPYMDMAMGEGAPGAGDGIDALYFSPHKFLGGPGASGVLVADRRMFGHAVPAQPGGGTVAYVTASTHRYVSDIERREEAGTPNVLGDIRAGMAMRLKRDIGADEIHRREQAAIVRAVAAWGNEEGIEILGGTEAERLAIFALVIRSGGRVLHPGLVVAALNDLFGIQARAGCSCAGPYGHSLLDICETGAARYDALVARGFSMFRPGWTRLGFHVLHDAASIEYIIAAVRFVARRGGDLLALYAPDLRTGRWTSREGARPETRGLAELCDWGSTPAERVTDAVPDYAAALEEAERIADVAARADHRDSGLGAVLAAEELGGDLWFALPDHAPRTAAAE